MTIVAPPAAPETPTSEIDRIVERLAARKDAWVRVGIEQRIEYLRGVIDGVLAEGEAWVAEACRHKGIDPASPLAGEEWITGPMVTVRNARLLIRALRAGGQPKPHSIREEAGRIIARVFPEGILDRFLYYDMVGEVWIEPGKPATQGEIYRRKAAGEFPPGRVTLVLGAGNIASIAPLDVLYALFAEDKVVVLKMNPVNDYLGPILERALGALVRDGFVALAYGGAEVGEHLARHPDVDTIHMTGSDRTYDAIVWGADSDERARRKAEGRPRVDKPFSAELGNVSPVLVVPGDWSEADLRFQARHVASMVAHNAGFNCNAARVLVLPKSWDRRAAFLERVRAELAATPPRRAYYPGAFERHRAFLERYPNAVVVGRADDGVVPWTLIPDVPPESGEYALRTESFCGVLSEVSLEGDDPEAFLDHAVRFANEKIWGTLSCAVLIKGRTVRAHTAAFRRALAHLRYGGIGVNVWPGVNFAMGTTSWGAFPGHTKEQIGSGQGVVHNTYLFDHPERSIMYASFRIWPKPVWFAKHRTLDVVGKHLARFEGTRSPWSLVRLGIAGVAG